MQRAGQPTFVVFDTNIYRTINNGNLEEIINLENRVGIRPAYNLVVSCELLNELNEPDPRIRGAARAALIRMNRHVFEKMTPRVYEQGDVLISRMIGLRLEEDLQIELVRQVGEMIQGLNEQQVISEQTQELAGRLSTFWLNMEREYDDRSNEIRNTFLREPETARDEIRQTFRQGGGVQWVSQIMIANFNRNIFNEGQRLLELSDQLIRTYPLSVGLETETYRDLFFGERIIAANDHHDYQISFSIRADESGSIDTILVTEDGRIRRVAEGLGLGAQVMNRTAYEAWLQERANS